MTAEQFDALAALLRMRVRGDSAQAARLVLVDGLDKEAAARRCGITQNALRMCLVRCEQGRELAKIVTEIAKSE